MPASRQAAPLGLLISALLLLSQAHASRLQPSLDTVAAGRSLSQAAPVISRAAIAPRLPILRRLWAHREALLANHKPHHESFNFTYLAICTVVRDDERLLWEWLMYHYKVMKVQRFYVFDNNSTTTMLPTLLPLIKAGIVVYEYFTYSNGLQGGPFPQPYAYTQCMRRWRSHHEWMAFLDVDEFLVLRQPPASPAPPPAEGDPRKLQPRPQSPLEVLLSEYEGAGGLAISWVMFGSDGYDAPPPGVLGYYNTCMNYDHVKTIASTHLWRYTINPHFHLYIGGAVAVDERGVEVAAHQNMPQVSRVAIFHYTLRSKQHYLRKVERSGAWGRSTKSMAAFHAHDQAINSSYHTAHPQCNDLHKFKDCFTLDSTKDCSAVQGTS